MLKRFMMVLVLGSVVCLGGLSGCSGSKEASMPENVDASPKEEPAQQQMKPPTPPPRPS